MPAGMKNIVAESGVQGLFTGIVPRIGLGVWQTLFMVTGAKIVKDIMDKAFYAGVEIILPEDFVISSEFGEGGEITNELS